MFLFKKNNLDYEREDITGYVLEEIYNSFTSLRLL